MFSSTRASFYCGFGPRRPPVPSEKDEYTMNQNELPHNLIRGLLLFVVAALLLVSPSSLASSVPLTEVYFNDTPDLVVTGIDFGNNCTNDDISGSVSVTVKNEGTATANNFQVALDTDGCLSFSDNQTVTTLDPGSSITVTFNISGSWANCSDCGCDFTATVDATDAVAESSETNNALTETYNSLLPNLRVTSVTPSFNCAADGSLTGNVAVTVGNNGCGDAANVPVQLTSTGTYTFTNQTVTLTQGASTTLNFAFTPTAANCDVDFTATIDPSNTFCECTGSDNSVTYSNFTPNIPDLTVQADTLSASCSNNDGEVSVTGGITITNNGCGSNLTSDIPMRFTLFDNTGCSGNQVVQWTETLSPVNIAAGGAQVFTITPYNMTADLCDNSTDCQVSIRVEADYTDSICECDSTDNTLCTDKSLTIPDLTVNSVTPASGPNGNGTVTVNVGNAGCGAANGAVVRLTSDCGLDFSDQTIDLATSASTDLVFNFTPNCADCVCTFVATIDPENDICECSGANNGMATVSGTMTIVKDAVPDGAQDFSFTGDLGDFDLDDDPGDAILPDSRTFVLAAATYSVTEAPVPAGWNLAVIVCDDPDGGTTTSLGTATATIDLDAGEIIACTFTNTIPVSVTTATGTGVATFESDKGVIQDLTAVSEGTLTCPAEGKPNLVFVHSFFSFSITGLTPCASETVVVTIKLPSAVPVGAEYWKCHDGAWLDVTSLLGENDGDNVLTLTLTDGGLGDDDGVCDGVIVDDGGPGQEPPVPVGGIAVPVNKLVLLGPWLGMAALASLAALTVALVRRRGG